jgi:rhodanese-related sulfurtransferase
MPPVASDAPVTPSSENLNREQLQAKLTLGEPFNLVMAGHDWAFRAKHIPGSIHFSRPEDLFAAVDPDEEVVVYCSNEDCHASAALIQKLREHGYRRVSHYPGGLIDWEAAGLPLEGDWTASDRDR